MNTYKILISGSIAATTNTSFNVLFIKADSVETEDGHHRFYIFNKKLNCTEIIAVIPWTCIVANKANLVT